MLLNTGRRPCGSKDARGLGGKGGDNINEDQVAGSSGYPKAMRLSSSPAAEAVAVVTEEGHRGDPTSSSFSISTSARVRALDARRRGFRVVVAGAEVAVAAAGRPAYARGRRLTSRILSPITFRRLLLASNILF